MIFQLHFMSEMDDHCKAKPNHLIHKKMSDNPQHNVLVARFSALGTYEGVY